MTQLVSRCSGKNVAVFTNGQLIDAVVPPGLTTADLLRQVNLPDEYFVSKAAGLPFGADEVLFDQIRDGEKLYATPPANVG